MAAAALLALALVVAVVGVRGRLADRVQVVTDVEPLRCTGTEVQPQAMSSDDDFAVAVAAIKPGMDCTYRFFVENHSGMDVTIETVSVPVVGPAAGAGIRGTHLNPTLNSASGPLEDEVAGIWRVDDQILDGERQGYEVSIEFSPGGCTAEGGTIFPRNPAITVTAWAMTVAVEPDTTSIGFAGSNHTNC